MVQLRSPTGYAGPRATGQLSFHWLEREVIAAL
ncbi:hypothetical protein LINGRAHAP2_LOCUS12954 [Linum grandiflorum]